MAQISTRIKKSTRPMNFFNEFSCFIKEKFTAFSTTITEKFVKLSWSETTWLESHGKYS